MCLRIELEGLRSEVLKQATKGNVQKAAKAAAELARHQAQPVADAVGQATRDTAHAASSISDVLQGILFVLTVSAYHRLLLQQHHCSVCW